MLRAARINSTIDGEDPELWKWRRLELIVRIDLSVRRMIHGDQLGFVEKSDFAQLFRYAHFIAAVSQRQCLAGDLNKLVVIDWEEADSDALVDDMQKSDPAQKRTVVAITTLDRHIPGTHLVLRKPVTPESGTKSLKMAYSRMLQDYRRHVRYALMSAVMATDENNRLMSAMITDIGDGGIGLSSKQELSLGNVLSMHVLLPDARRAIYIEARVLWTRPYGIAGCEFLRIPPIDLDILHDWLKRKCQIKKPLVEV